ncbi:MAG: type II toxin-antitoxin system prevent-host-death family antitoxin [Phycisphaeraceae bacterium]
MRTVNIREARRQLSEIVDAAERGQSALISRHGRDVAQIGPVQTEAGGALPDLTEFRASVRIKGKPLSKLLVESRRQARY